MLIKFLRKFSVFFSLLQITLLYIFMPFYASGAEIYSHHKHLDHGDGIFHKFSVETSINHSRHGNIYDLDIEGFVGGDYNKLWLKAQSQKLHNHAAEKAEFWAMYSRNIADFWDGQIGIKFDEQPKAVNSLVLGFMGLAPYFFETEAYLFTSEKGDITARLSIENDLHITQKLITKPYMELNFAFQNVAEQEIASGLTTGEFGVQTRYKVTPKFAPYIDFKYESKFYDTRNIAKNEGDYKNNFLLGLGVKVIF